MRRVKRELKEAPLLLLKTGVRTAPWEPEAARRPSEATTTQTLLAEALLHSEGGLQAPRIPKDFPVI